MSNKYLDIAMEKVIKQEVNKVLDKIRAEIEAYQSDAFYSDDVTLNKRMVLEIIDKYKAESEVSDGDSY